MAEINFELFSRGLANELQLTAEVQKGSIKCSKVTSSVIKSISEFFLPSTDNGKLAQLFFYSKKTNSRKNSWRKLRRSFAKNVYHQMRIFFFSSHSCDAFYETHHFLYNSFERSRKTIVNPNTSVIYCFEYVLYCIWTTGLLKQYRENELLFSDSGQVSFQIKIRLKRHFTLTCVSCKERPKVTHQACHCISLRTFPLIVRSRIIYALSSMSVFMANVSTITWRLVWQEADFAHL